ncbi:MAG: hypothetical protein R2795_25225 [Saprospiraceae bacterium]
MLRGRCDALVETTDTLYLRVQARSNCQAALQQIHDKGYLTPYADSHKKVVAIGADYSSETKQIEEWVVK